MKKLTYILYDGIKNSVFVSLILKPLLKRLDNDNSLEIMLVTFEKTKPSNKTLIDLIPAHDRLHLVICKKLPFWGKSSLWLAKYQLKKLLKIYPTNNIIARGSLAGLVTFKTVKKNIKNINLTIQARGLCAEEYRFANQKKENLFIKKIINKFIYRRLKTIETQIYSQKNIIIEAVSPALKTYINQNFNADNSKIKIENLENLTQNISEKEKKFWKNKIRKKLNISQDKTIYCYSGSYKAWQGLPEIINFFKEKHKQNKNIFLLILSSDKKIIQKMLFESTLPDNSYLVLNIHPENLYKYLSACNIGLLFREKDIINWVSRPTKMLEYQAAGLEIVHNNTIALLANQNETSTAHQIQ